MSELINKIVSEVNDRLNDTTLGTSIALELTGEGRIVMDDTGARASDEETACEITMKPKTFNGLVDGSVNPMTAVMLGKIKIKGDMTAAMSLQKILG